MAKTDLNIKITSNLGTTQQFLLYQNDIRLNVKNYKVAAWERHYIAPGAEFNVVLPLDIQVGATTDLGKGHLKTRKLSANYNTAWDIVKNNNALDIAPSSEVPPTENTIEIHNKYKDTQNAVVFKDGKPLFACEVRPEYKVNFAIHPKLFLALCDLEINDEFFDAACLSKMPTVIDYEGQSYLNISLNENVSTGQVTVKYDFLKPRI